MTPIPDAGNRFEAGGHLRRSADGIWRADAAVAAVSFPRGGHRECAELEDASFWFRHRNRCIVALVQRFPGMIFDVGGGTGFVSLALRQAGFSTALIEPEVAGAEIAQRRGVDPVICSTLEGAGFSPGSLAGIGMFDVIEHVADDVSLLNAARELLRPDGRLYLTVPAHQWLWSADDGIAGHHRRYSSTGLAERLHASGFRVDFLSYMFWPLPPAILIGRRIAGMVGRRSNDPDRYRRQHEVSRSRAGLVDRLLDLEFRLIDRGRTVPLGSSCIAVASPLAAA